SETRNEPRLSVFPYTTLFRSWKVRGANGQGREQSNHRRSQDQESSLERGNNRTLVPSLLAVQNSPHPSSNRPMVRQSHLHQEENAEREPEGTMGARMGRVQEVPRLARRRSRLGNITPTLLGRPTPNLDL